MPLKNLLFKDRAFPPLRGGPLFTSQVDLAEQVVKARGQNHNKVESTRSLINQVLRGRSALSVSLQQAIETAVRARLEARLEDAVEVATAMERLAEEFAQSEQTKPLDEEEEFEALDREGKKAAVHFILNFEPAEIIASEKAEILKNELAERLGLVSTPEEPKSEVKYIFYVPDPVVAQRLWMKLHEFLIRKNVKEPAERLADVSGSNNLEVWTAPPCACVHPTVVFDPEKPERRGFVLYYHRDNRVSVARMSPESLNQWIKFVYYPLTQNRGLILDEKGELIGDDRVKARNEAKRVRWEDVQQHIQKED